MKKVTPLTPMRALYNQLIDEYKGYPNAIITDSFLRFEQPLNPTLVVGTAISSLNFPTLTNQGLINSTEKRLDITDRFCCGAISVMIEKVVAAAPLAATQAEIAIGRPRTWNNDKIFAGAAEAANLEAIYNGNLKITVDSKVYIQSLDIRRFYRVGIAQQGVLLSTAGGAPATLGGDEYDESGYPFAPLTPTITFSGQSKNDIQFNMPNGNGSPVAINVGGVTGQNFMIVIVRGFLIQNVNQPK